MHTCVLSHFSCVQLFANLCTIALQAPLFLGLSRQEYWIGLPFALLGDHWEKYLLLTLLNFVRYNEDLKETVR